MSVERVSELECLLIRASQAYYELNPIMSDQEFDARRSELQNLNPNSTFLKAVGSDVSSLTMWEKVEHSIPMGSLDKVNTVDEFRGWCDKVGADKYLITHKIDGCSLEVVYKDGKLLRGVGRGDGLVGEDTTVNVLQIPGIPHTIETLGDVCVRGEVVMFKDTFQREYAGEYANPRNTANGKLREKKGGGADCQNLNFLAYTIYVDGNRSGTEYESFGQLRDMGFEVPYYEVGDQFDIARVFGALTTARDLIHYEVDGMVVRVNDISKQDSLGSKNMRPVGQIAWKFDSEKTSAKVVGVQWSVGPTGRQTPVALIEPTKIGGVTITNVNLHNLKMFKELKLFAGCEVLISRRNDVIPYVEQTISVDKPTTEEYFAIPECCPICTGMLSPIKDLLYCKNDNCSFKLSGVVKVWIKKLGILHWGDAVISKLTDPKDPQMFSIGDIYRLDPGKLATASSGPKMGLKLYRSLHANKTMSLEMFMGSLNLPDLGLSTATDIVQAGYDSVEKFVNITYDNLVGISNVGDKTARKVLEALFLRKDEILDLASVLVLKTPGGELKGLSFCVTGTTKKPRKTIHKDITDNGGIVKGSVGKDLYYLITNEDPETFTSGKMKKAQELSKKGELQIISEEHFYRMLNKAHVQVLDMSDEDVEKAPDEWPEPEPKQENETI